METSVRRKGPMPVERAGHLLHPLRALMYGPSALLRDLAPAPDAQVLELGAGPGYYSLAVARAVPRGRLWLVDVQPGMLDLARRRLDAAGVRNAECVAADAASLGLPAQTFDAAFLVAVLGELPDPALCLREVRRVLRPGGSLLVAEQLGDPDRLRVAELRRLVAAAGLRLERVHRGLLAWSLRARA